MMIETAAQIPADRTRASRQRGRRRWRRANAALSGALGAVALSGALYLGVTGPLTSPVQPGAPAGLAPAAVAPGAAGTGSGQSMTTDQQGRGTAGGGQGDHDGDHLVGSRDHGGHGGGR